MAQQHLLLRLRCRNHTLARSRVLAFLETTAPLRIPKRRITNQDFHKNWIIHDELQGLLRPSYTGLDHTGDTGPFLDTGFSVCFLGTGSGKSTVDRGNSATVLRVDGNLYLFDAGEGVQMQFTKSSLRFSDIKAIFVTHMHADHIFGLPGLLLTLQDTARASGRRKRQVLKIYGPEGLYNYLAMAISLSAAEIRSITIEVYELRLGHNVLPPHPGARKYYREFRQSGMFRKAIPRNPDGSWTLEECDEILTPEQAIEYDGRPRGLNIRAAEVYHVPRVQSIGYVVSEGRTQPRKIDLEKAIAAGVAPGKKYRVLKSGFSVKSDDETRDIHAAEVLVDEPQKSRKFAILGDCKAVSSSMKELCRDTDVLVHEATLLSHEEGRRVEFGGHSTAEKAGRVANEVSAGLLCLNHISPGSANDDSRLELLLKEAIRSTDGLVKVQLSYDFLEVMVPREGFKSTKDS